MSIAPTIDQIISQASTMNSTTPLDLNTLFEEFDDTHHFIQQPYGAAAVADAKTLHGKPTNADALVQSLLFSPTSSSTSSSSTPSFLQQYQYQPSPMINTPCLEAFTPGLTGFMGDSPALATPFMDPTGGSHFMGASGMDLDCIENYFTPQMATAPDCAFSSVDPSDLGFGLQQQQQQSSTTNAAGDNDDSLFPPLSHEEQQLQYDGGIPSAGNDLDLLFDDLFSTNDVFPSNDTGLIVQQQDSTTSDNNKKRKRVDANENYGGNAYVDDDQVNQMVKEAKLNNDTDTPRQFVCTVCQRAFSRRYNLGTHIKTHNKNRSKPFACHLCDKSFDRKHDCERHVSTVHLGERLYACKPCKVSFSRRDALSRHQLQKHTTTN